MDTMKLTQQTPRKSQSSLNEEDQTIRGGPKNLNDLSTNLISKTDQYIVINKAPDTRLDGQFNVTIEKALHRDFPSIDKFRWVHQLDFATSGVLCVALTKEAASTACKLFRERLVHKEYLALVYGHIPINPEEAVNRCRLSELPDIMKKYKDTPVKRQPYCRKSKKQPKGPRSASSFFEIEKNRLMKQSENGLSNVRTRKKWKEHSRAEKEPYFELARLDKIRFEQELKEYNDAQATSFEDEEAINFTKRRKFNVSDEPIGYIFNQAIADSKSTEFHMKISKDGKKSCTVAFVLGHGYIGDEPISKVLLRPISGRRHQLRLHLMHAGYPIVGDTTYGKNDDDKKRMMLHAWRLWMPLEDTNTFNTIFETSDPFADYVESIVSMDTFDIQMWKR